MATNSYQNEGLQINSDDSNDSRNSNDSEVAGYYQLWACSRVALVVSLCTLVSLLSLVSLVTLKGSKTENFSVIPPVVLGPAGDFVLLSNIGITTTGNSLITGDVAIAPSDSTSLYGFNMTMDPTNSFGSSKQVVGKMYASDFSMPTQQILRDALPAQVAAWGDAMSRNCSTVITDLSGMTLTPGVYCSNSTINDKSRPDFMSLSTGSLTFSGGPNDIWIFQVSANLKIGAGTSMVLLNNSNAKNIFWAVGGDVNIKENAQVKGIVSCRENVYMDQNASLNGQIYAVATIALNDNQIQESYTKKS